MSKKKTDLKKHTLNLRPGDFDRMGELFPNLGSSLGIRTLISRFVDQNYQKSKVPTKLSIKL